MSSPRRGRKEKRREKGRKAGQRRKEEGRGRVEKERVREGKKGRKTGERAWAGGGRQAGRKQFVLFTTMSRPRIDLEPCHLWISCYTR